jgi:hypothetical protein
MSAPNNGLSEAGRALFLASHSKIPCERFPTAFCNHWPAMRRRPAYATDVASDNNRGVG